MLQRRDSGIRWKGIEEINLEKLLGVRKKAVEMIQVLRRQPFTEDPCVSELASQLPRRLPEVPEEGLPSLGVRSSPRGTDDRVDCIASCWREEGKKSIETLALKRVEVRQMSIKNLKPELRPVLPKIRDLPVIQTTRGSRVWDMRSWMR